MARKKKMPSFIWLIGAVFYYFFYTIYAVLSYICWPIKNPTVKVIKDTKFIEREGPTIKVLPKTVAGRILSKVDGEDKKDIKDNWQTKAAFINGARAALEAVATDNGMVIAITEQLELRS